MMAKTVTLTVFFMCFASIHTHIFNVNNECYVKGNVAFCTTPLQSGIYNLRTAEVTRIVFSRIHANVLLSVSKKYTPRLLYIKVQVGPCPAIQMNDLMMITVESSNTKCSVSVLI